MGWRVAAPLALMALIFYLSAQEAVGPDLPAWTRVVAHAAEYAALATLWAWALWPKLGVRALVAAAAISLVYALSDEWHQSFVPGRDADPLDVAADTLGIALALAALARAHFGAFPARRGPDRNPRSSAGE
jgi:VanZ family protein